MQQRRVLRVEQLFIGQARSTVGLVVASCRKLLYRRRDVGSFFLQCATVCFEQ